MSTLTNAELEDLCGKCGSCLSPDTLILHVDYTWRPIGDVQIGDKLLSFDEFPEDVSVFGGVNAQEYKGKRKYRLTTVERVWWRKKKTKRLITEKSDIITTDDHKWFTNRGWRETHKLSKSYPIGSIPFVKSSLITQDYRAGYIAGMTLGGGSFHYVPSQTHSRKNTTTYAPLWRVALKDEEPIGRLAKYFSFFNCEVCVRPFVNSCTSYNPYAEMVQVRTAVLKNLSLIYSFIHTYPETGEYKRGFVAGFFDAEGSFCDRHLRICQNDKTILEKIRRFGSFFGFSFSLRKISHIENSTVYDLNLLGGSRKQLEFFTFFTPAISRKSLNLLGSRLTTASEPAVCVEDHVVSDVVDIQTSTHTFFAEGLATHNCCQASVPDKSGYHIVVKGLKCKFLKAAGGKKNLCSVYDSRFENAPWCRDLAKGIEKGMYPSGCPYVSDVEGYKGKVFLRSDRYRLIEPQIIKSFLSRGQPAWCSDGDWIKFVGRLTDTNLLKSVHVSKVIDSITNFDD